MQTEARQVSEMTWYKPAQIEHLWVIIDMSYVPTACLLSEVTLYFVYGYQWDVYT